MQPTTRVHIDGASRGNPGPAAWAVSIVLPDGSLIEQAEPIGTTTNNVAEYTALVRGLQRCRACGAEDLVVHSDSELLVKQMNGVYKVKSADLQPLYAAAREQLGHFNSVRFVHVRRELNKRADELCNLALDGQPTLADAEVVRLQVPERAEAEGLPDRCMQCLLDAKRAWAAGENLSVLQVWNDLRELLNLDEEGNPRTRGQR